MATYTLSRLAEEDLRDIYEYTLQTWDLEQFKRYHLRLSGALTTLANNPEQVPSKAREDLAPGCRLYHVEYHYIAYRKSGKGIEVGRILHERMHFEEQVSGSVFDS